MDTGLKEREKFWDKMALSYSEGAAVGRFLREIDERAEDILSTLDIGKGAHAMDLCCGNGLLTNMMIGGGVAFTGVDLSHEMIKKGKNTAEKCGLNAVTYLQGDAARLPFADDTFDASCCLSSFQLFSSEYAGEVLRELVRVTRPTGRVLIGEIPWKETFGYMIWNLIRARGDGETDRHIPFQDLPLYKKIGERISLVFRRFTGRRVTSDNWVWYDKAFFQGVKTSKFEKIQFLPSTKKGFLKYQFDVVILN